MPQTILKKIEELEASLTGEYYTDLEIKSQINRLKKELYGKDNRGENRTD